MGFKRIEGESEAEYILRASKEGLRQGLTWQEIANIINQETKRHSDESTYRRKYNKAYAIGFRDGVEKVSKAIEETEYEDDSDESELSKLLKARTEIKKEKVKMSDERVQINAYIRRLAREDTLKEIAINAAKEVAKLKPIDMPVGSIYCTCSGKANSAILEVSDWHLGLDFENYWNVYNVEECKNRVKRLTEEVVKKCKDNNVLDLYVVNLADLIAGRIHLQIRLESRIDVITQTMTVAEILSDMLTTLSQYFKVHYYGCLDNHSRIEPNKKESMDLESLARIIPWYLKERIGQYIEINENEFGADIITFDVNGHSIIGVHGDKDKPLTVVQKLTCMTQKHYDMVLTAHLHHFSADEQNETLVVSNGSLMGTDTYAAGLRLTSKASQNLIIVTENNVAEAIYRIVLN